MRISAHILALVLLGAATLPATAQVPAGTPGVIGNTPGSFANSSGGLGVPMSMHPFPSPIATAPNRGKINGTALIRPGAPSGLGGPAKIATGINGTRIRSKR